MKLSFSLIACVTLALCALAACTKDGLTKDPSKKGSTTDSTAVAFNLTAFTWVLHSVEYPKTANAWETVPGSGSFDYDTVIFGNDHTFAFADNNTVTISGTWKLSDDSKRISLTYAGQTEVDTLGTLNSTTLQLIVPKQVLVHSQFYGYYRDSYIAKK